MSFQSLKVYFSQAKKGSVPGVLLGITKVQANAITPNVKKRFTMWQLPRGTKSLGHLVQKSCLHRVGHGLLSSATPDGLLASRSARRAAGRVDLPGAALANGGFRLCRHLIKSIHGKWNAYLG
jgi:hypothetical protein